MTTQRTVNAQPAVKGAPRSRARPADPSTTESAPHRNEVVIAGRLVAAAIPKQLPSGDEIVNWRLTVDRVSTDGTRRFDVISCTTSGARLRRQALAWSAGEVIEVTGALRHRFWRGVGGLQSRTEVEVASAARVKAPAGRRSATVTRPRKPG